MSHWAFFLRFLCLFLCRESTNRILHMRMMQSCSTHLVSVLSLSLCLISSICSPWHWRPQLSSTSLQVLLYLNSWYFAAFYLAEILMFIYKGVEPAGLLLSYRRKHPLVLEQTVALYFTTWLIIMSIIITAPMSNTSLFLYYKDYV